MSKLKGTSACTGHCVSCAPHMKVWPAIAWQLVPRFRVFLSSGVPVSASEERWYVLKPHHAGGHVKYPSNATHTPANPKYCMVVTAGCSGQGQRCCCKCIPGRRAHVRPARARGHPAPVQCVAAAHVRPGRALGQGGWVWYCTSVRVPARMLLTSLFWGTNDVCVCARCGSRGLPW
jgi:hypothetical protein